MTNVCQTVGHNMCIEAIFLMSATIHSRKKDRCSDAILNVLFYIEEKPEVVAVLFYVFTSFAVAMN